MELRWLASTSTSALHAADLLRRGRTLTDPAWQTQLEAPAAELARQLALYGDRAPQLWRHLLGLSAGVENNRQLAELALRKCFSNPGSIDAERIAGLIGQVEAAARRVRPQLADELILRARPLRDQWEARGPGLLKIMGRVDERLLVPRADVVLVHPVQGGGGAAHLLYNSVRFEGVLANPHADLPEVVRLAWLLAQLNQDLPAYSENLPAARLPELAALALMPVALAAGEHVELTRCDEAALQRAVEVWQGGDNSAATASVLLDWWQTWLEARPAWHVALAALDRMLS